MRVAIIATGFMGWSGGIDYIFSIYRGLDYLRKNGKGLDIYLFIPHEFSPLLLVKNIIRKLRGIEIPQYEQKLLSVFSSAKIKISYYNFFSISKLGIIDKGNGLCNELRKRKIDIVLPFLDYNIDHKKFGIPCIHYLFDFQHKYLPELFSKTEIENRDRDFEKITSLADSIVVNAKDVKNDIDKFYPSHRAIIYTLPFSPVISDEWLDIVRRSNDGNAGDIGTYGKYFIICNQFWKHKDHLCAFEAFEKFYNSGHTDYHLVTTGLMEDYRFPDYIAEIKERLSKYKSKNNIHLLGYVSKSYQIELMYNAVAVIQPTLFEGGPGGGAVYDGLSLEKRCIVSDLKVNKEIPNTYPVTFFSAGNSDDLASKLDDAANKANEKVSPDKLIERKEKIISNYAEYLWFIINDVMERYNSKTCEN